MRRSVLWAATFPLAFMMTLAAVLWGPSSFAKPDPLRIGFMPAPMRPQLQSGATSLAHLLSQELDRPVEAVISRDHAALLEGLASGHIDIAILNPLDYVSLRKKQAVEVIAQPTRYGVLGYRSQFITWRGSRVQKLSDLGGRTLAVVDTSSVTGHILPWAELTHQDATLPRAVQVVYLGSHEAVVQAVANRRVDAGATFDDARIPLAKQDPSILEATTVFAHTRSIPHSAVVTRNGMAKTERERMTQALLRVAANKVGVSTLRQIDDITGFAPATDQAFDIVRELELQF